MLSKIKSLTLLDWLFIVLFDLAVYTYGYRAGAKAG